MGRPAAGARKRQAQVKEDRLLNLIDQADTIKRYDTLLRKVSKGTLDVPAFLKEVSIDAALKVVCLMHASVDERIQLAAATDLLDRAGHNKTTKHQVGGVVVVDHQASKMELINLILSSAKKAGIKTKDGGEALLEARNVGPVVENPNAESYVDAMVVGLDEQATEPGTPECLLPEVPVDE